MKNHPSRVGLTRESGGRPVWTGEVRFNEAWIDEPLRWTRPRRIFVCAHGDLFHEAVPDAWIDRVFAVMALAPRHTFQVLTKRPERMRDYLRAAGFGIDTRRDGRDTLIEVLRQSHMLGVSAATSNGPWGSISLDRETHRWTVVWPLPNVWLGTSIEDQATADARIEHLLSTPAAVRFLSAEPLLGPVDLGRWLGQVHHHPDNDRSHPALNRLVQLARRTVGPSIDWVIVGGESGPGARPMQEEWAQRLRDQCVAAGVAFHFKQWGEFAPSTEFREGQRFMVRRGKADAGRVLDGRTWDEMPAVSHG
jgi:protein gp37